MFGRIFMVLPFVLRSANLFAFSSFIDLSCQSLRETNSIRSSMYCCDVRQRRNFLENEDNKGADPGLEMGALFSGV